MANTHTHTHTQSERAKDLWLARSLSGFQSADNNTRRANSREQTRAAAAATCLIDCSAEICLSRAYCSLSSAFVSQLSLILFCCQQSDPIPTEPNRTEPNRSTHWLVEIPIRGACFATEEKRRQKRNTPQLFALQLRAVNFWPGKEGRKVFASVSETFCSKFSFSQKTSKEQGKTLHTIECPLLEGKGFSRSADSYRQRRSLLLLLVWPRRKQFIALESGRRRRRRRSCSTVTIGGRDTPGQRRCGT